MAQQPTPQSTLIAKLESMAETLTPAEREVLGEILLHAAQTDTGAGEVQGYAFSFGAAPLLGTAIGQAQTANKTFTRLHLGPAVLQGTVIAAAGPVARR